MPRTHLLAAFLSLAVATAAAAPSASAGSFARVPPSEDQDLKLYREDGGIITGPEALARMPTEAGLVLWLAGNQFFAMDRVIGAFRAAHPEIAVGLVTLPPGLMLTAIEQGGWTYGGKDYPGVPDIYASVELGHIQRLKADGLMQRYAIYLHNELAIMVARGNPEHVTGIDDLARPGLRIALPNPTNEGIMQFYARKVLERHGIWAAISGGCECAGCQPTARTWFTAVHHRETPQRILAGESDAGIVWRTEITEAQRRGEALDGVALPPEDSLRNEVAYAIGALTAAPHPANAEAYLDFVATPAARDAYREFGFVDATADELRQKPIP